MAVLENSSVRFRHLIDELRFADETLINSGEIDEPILYELRLALDNLRLTAWAASARNAQQAVNEPNAVISFLRSERLRRFRQIIDAFCAEVEREGATWSPTTIHDLQESLSVLRERLSLLAVRRRTGMRN